MGTDEHRADRPRTALVAAAVLVALLVAIAVVALVGDDGESPDEPALPGATTTGPDDDVEPDRPDADGWRGDFAGSGPWQERFGIVHQRDEPVTGATVEQDVPERDGPALRIRFGEDGSRWGLDARSSFDALGLAPAEDVTLSYDVYFPEDFEFVGDGKMGGLAGTSGGLEVYQASAGGEFRPGSFSVRAMWKEDRGVVMYLYALHGAGRWIDDSFHGGYGIQERFVDEDGDEEDILRPGTWHEVRHRVKLNTPGRNDGIYELWIDGHRGIHLDDIRYRDDEEEDLRVDQVVLGFFFGGGSDEYPSRVSELYTDEWELRETGS